MTKSATREAADKVTFTQAEVTSAVALKAPIANPVFTGNVGVGVTPESTWHSTHTVLQLGDRGALIDDAGGITMMSNSYYDSGWKYLNTDLATNYESKSGAHKFQVAPSGTADAAISWNTAMTIDNAGIVTKPLQPAFQAHVTSNLQNLPINGQYVIPYGTERFDQNSDFNNSTYTFTAPVTGKYQLNGNVYLNNVVSASGYVEFYIVTSNRTYYSILAVNGFDTDLLYFTMPHTVLADMDAGDTAKCAIWLASGSQTTDLRDDSFFSGYLVA